MSDTPQKPIPGVPEANAPVPPTQGASAPPTDNEATAQSAPRDDDQPDLHKVIQGLQDEVGRLNDQLLRAHAEMDNVRKRMEREKADIAKYAITKFATDIVTVGDNLGLALSAVKPGATEADPVLKALVDGVTVTDRALVAVLERHGVRRIDPKGDIFNPHLHQAIAQVTDESVAAGTIIQVHQAGYVIEERVLRPATVVVAQGGSRPVKPAATDASPASATDAPTNHEAAFTADRPANGSQ